MVSKHKVALITGAARRIGAGIARTLHEAGMNVVIHYHTSQEEAENLCAELNAKRKKSAIAVYAQLSNPDNLPKVIQKALKAWNRLDVLVNNASCFYKSHIGGVTEAEWDTLFNCNLKAPFFLSQAAGPYLKKNHGCIVNIADIHGERPLTDYSVYSMTKAGLIMMTKALAKELGPKVRVNAISPGAVAWPEGKNALSKGVKDKIIKSIALKRHGGAGDIAKAVLYVVRDADYVTGQVLIVDGGRDL